MDHADTAQLAAVLGALGAALVLLARTRSLLLAGFALLGCAEAGLIWSLSGEGGSDLAVGPLKLAAGAAGLVLLALGVAALVRWPATITPLVLAAAPFRLPLDVDPDARFFLSVAESGELGRLLPLYGVLGAASLALIARVVRGQAVQALPLYAALPAAAFTAFAVLSLLWTRDLEAGTTTLAFFLLPFTALVAVVARAPFPASLPRVLAVIAVALATLFALIGLWQALTRELLFAAPNLEVANTYAPIFRVTSLFRDPSLYGRHVVLGIAVAVVAIWLRRIPALPALALVALLWAGLYFSYSQSSLAALFAAVLAISAIAGSRGVRRAVAAAAAVLLLVGSALVVNEALDTSVRRATSDRSRRVELTARVLADHPVAGVGIGSQPFASQQLSERAGPKPNFVSHATPVTVGAELGVIGLLAYAALLVSAAFLIEAVRRRDAALGLTLAATLLALFVHALFYSGFFEDPITWLVLAIGAGYLVSRDQAAEQVATIAPSPEPALT
ncbi:MAG: O-antigen ligase family protein [Actinobacteria bacterium]|nr:O-antigen ligase family protein [Actinomycetota bacterium]